VLKNSDLPLDKMGRVICLPTLQVAREDGTVVDGAWAAGDCAAVPDLINPGKFCPPNAQHALREGNHIGDNLAKAIKDQPPTPYQHKNIGAVASLGMYKGVAQMFGRIKVRGLPAWVMHRSYHVLAMPTFNRKVRIAAGWTGSLLFRREVVALGSLHDPRAEFRNASEPPKVKPQQADVAPVTAKDAATAPDVSVEQGQSPKKDASHWDK
jgi:NADH:ubiquinone reductase (H+-translocating)